MTVTLLAAADEPESRPEDLPQPAPGPTPGQPAPDPEPLERGPWWQPRIAQHRRGTNPGPLPRQQYIPGPNTFTIAVCGCGYPPGDGCTCTVDLAETLRAFAPAGLVPGAYGPIVLDLTGGATC